MTETNKEKIIQGMKEAVVRAKKTSRVEAHNLGAHEERMAKRRAVQRLRTVSKRVKVGFFIPAVEDKKHQSWREASVRIS